MLSCHHLLWFPTLCSDLSGNIRGKSDFLTLWTGRSGFPYCPPPPHHHHFPPNINFPEAFFFLKKWQESCQNISLSTFLKAGKNSSGGGRGRQGWQCQGIGRKNGESPSTDMLLWQHRIQNRELPPCGSTQTLNIIYSGIHIAPYNLYHISLLRS